MGKPESGEMCLRASRCAIVILLLQSEIKLLLSEALSKD
jgi:hypothetical protein